MVELTNNKGAHSTENAGMSLEKASFSSSCKLKLTVAIIDSLSVETFRKLLDLTEISQSIQALLTSRCRIFTPFLFLIAYAILQPNRSILG